MTADQPEPPEASWPVEPEPAAVGQSRHLAVSLVRQWVPGLPEEYVDRVRQVVGELVANAVQHVGRGPITVDLWLTPRGNLAVVVTDPSPAPPVPCEPYEDSTRGRGLHVVADQTITWSWQPQRDGGKTVCATVALPALAASPAQCRAELPAARGRAARPDSIVHRAPGPALRSRHPAA